MISQEPTFANASQNESKILPFSLALFKVALPTELNDKIFLELPLTAPGLVIIQHQATQEQKEAVISGKAYHVIRDESDPGNPTYSLGFAKKSNTEEFIYETAPLDKKSVFYHLVTVTSERFFSMADTSAEPRDTYGFYFLEEAIRKAGGLVYCLENRIRFSGVCRNFRDLINANLRQELFKLTMQHLLFGNQAMVERLVDADPSLLLEKNTISVKDISGKLVVQKTLLQAALCAGDVANNPGEIAMAEMLQRYFQKLENAQEAMQTQVSELFSKGLSKHNKAQKKKAKKFKNETLSSLIDAIRAATDEQIQEMLTEKRANSDLGKAFDHFRKEVERLNFEDDVFNPYYLLEAFKHYNNLHNEFDRQRQWRKTQLFSIQGIGFIQRFLPACYLQAFAQSLNEINEKSKELIREFTFKYHNIGVAVCCVDPISSLSGLGFSDGVLDVGYHRSAYLSKNVDKNFQNFCQKKAESLSKLCKIYPSAEVGRFCSVM